MIEKVLSGFFLVFSIGYLYFASDLAFGSTSSPKSGFLPIITGVAGSVLAFINFISVMRKKNDGKNSQMNFKKVILFSIGLLGYLVLLKFAGYPIATFAAMVYLLKITEIKGWIMPIAISAGTAGGFYLVFEKLLSVMLP